MIDEIINYIHVWADGGSYVFEMYNNFTQLKFPYAKILTLVGNAINCSTMSYELNNKNESLYWLHSFILVFLNGFGGGFLSSMLIGQASMPLLNDYILPIVIIAWYTTHYLPYVQFFLVSTPIRAIWSIFLGLFRTHALCNIVKSASIVITPTQGYSIALFGPIIVGTVMGSTGFFFQHGWKAIDNGTPWVMQGNLIHLIHLLTYIFLLTYILGAFLGGTFYHLIVLDKEGFFGNCARSLFGSHSDDTTRTIIASVHIFTLLAQTIFASDANFFTPFYKFFYLIFQVNGPSKVNLIVKSKTVGWDYKTRILLKKGLDLSRLLVVITVISAHIYVTQLPTTLYSGEKLFLEEKLGKCQMLKSIRNCSPYTLVFEKRNDKNDYSLSSYKSLDNNDQFLHWSLPININKMQIQNDLNEKNIFASLGLDGYLRLIYSDFNMKNEIELWKSNEFCSSQNQIGKSKIFLSLNFDGFPVINCENGNSIILKNN